MGSHAHRLRGGVDRQATLLLAGSLASAAVLAAVTVASMQLACALVLTGAVLVLFRSSHTAGLIALWLLWLVAPSIRRVFGLIDGYLSADPLALAPFVATAGVATLAFARVDLSRRVRAVLGAALLGLALGVPAAVSEPRSGLFALAAYGSAVLCVVVGYGEGSASGSGFTLRRALFVAAPLVAVYGILQYFLPLTEWDERWLTTVDLGSIGAPEEGRIRIFSTLNSPGTLAAVLALAALFVVASRRLSLVRAAMLVLLMTALSLTYVRSALVGLVGGLLGLALATRGRAGARIAVLLVATVIPVLLLSAVSPTGQAIVDRVTTFGSLQDDASADARLATPLEVLPDAARRPLGHGLGSAGEATKLRDSGGLSVTDNGYLALMWQLGPMGFLLVVGAAVAAFSALARARLVAAEDIELKGIIMAGLVMLLVLALGGDVFYGVSGAFFWYLVGKALWLADQAPAASPLQVPQWATRPLPAEAGRLVTGSASLVGAESGLRSRPAVAHLAADRGSGELPPPVSLPAVPWAPAGGPPPRRRTATMPRPGRPAGLLAACSAAATRTRRFMRHENNILVIILAAVMVWLAVLLLRGPGDDVERRDAASRPTATQPDARQRLEGPLPPRRLTQRPSVPPSPAAALRANARAAVRRRRARVAARRRRAATRRRRALARAPGVAPTPRSRAPRGARPPAAAVNRTPTPPPVVRPSAPTPPPVVRPSAPPPPPVVRSPPPPPPQPTTESFDDSG